MTMFYSGSFADMFWKAFTGFGFGGTYTRAALTFLIFGLGVYTLLVGKWRDLRSWLIFVLLGLLSANVIRASLEMGSFKESRYLLCCLPLFLLVLGSGLLAFNWGRRSLLLTTIAFTSLILPAWYVITLDGYVTPYKRIQEWMTKNVPRGTFVLVDRHFEPYHELRIYGSPNVNYTPGCVNEPVSAYISNQWREGAEKAFVTTTNLSYLEITKQYWDCPQIGPWEFPRKHFKHHMAWTNESALRLRRMGFGARSDYYSGNTNRLIVEYFFNFPVDNSEE
jgi:hypothetical protein